MFHFKRWIEINLFLACPDPPTYPGIEMELHNQNDYLLALYKCPMYTFTLTCEGDRTEWRKRQVTRNDRGIAQLQFSTLPTNHQPTCTGIKSQRQNSL